MAAPRITCIDCRARLADPGSAWCDTCRPRNPSVIAGRSSTAPERYGLAALCLAWVGCAIVLWLMAPAPRSFALWLSGALFSGGGAAFNVSARAWREYWRSR